MATPIAGVFPKCCALQDQGTKRVWDADSHSFFACGDLAVDGALQGLRARRKSENVPSTKALRRLGNSMIGDHDIHLLLAADKAVCWGESIDGLLQFITESAQRFGDLGCGYSPRFDMKDYVYIGRWPGDLQAGRGRMQLHHEATDQRPLASR